MIYLHIEDFLYRQHRTYWPHAAPETLGTSISTFFVYTGRHTPQFGAPQLPWLLVERYRVFLLSSIL